MNLKEALQHSIKGGWEAPNRMFIARFNRGEISDNRIRSILKANGYHRITEESWIKSKRQYIASPYKQTI